MAALLAPAVARAVTVNLNAGDSVNLATVTNSGMAVQIGDKVFADFSWDNLNAPDVTASDINLRAVINPNDIGFSLEFTLPLTAGDMEIKDVAFEFTAAVTNSNNLISDLHLSIGGATSGDAVASVAEHAFTGGFGGLSLGEVDASIPGATESVTNLSSASAKIWIEKDIIVAGAFEFSDDFASITNIDQTFSQIPEPSTALLVGLGLLGIFAVNRKGHRS
ncbi:MAG TPA: PEP-CTERM sorting domain-containing protein [Verrucomicrobiae bacterium]|nr:PEP-CTERM sorting domain-containing protein [Verrucomicrobiae bacterium]